MTSPLVAVRPALELEAALQEHYGGRTGLGRWVRYSLKDILLGTDTVGANLTANNAAGQFAYRVVGQSMLVQIDVVSGLTLAAVAAQLKFRLPDNWQFAPRQHLGLPTSRASALANIYDGASSVGQLLITTADPVTLSVYKPLAANYTVGTVYISGQIEFECQQVGER